MKTRIKIIYGSDTGNTEHVLTDVLTPLLEEFDLEVKTVAEISPEDWATHDVYIIGVPTWYFGDLQSDWDDYFEEFKKIDFSGKHVAFFGLGDQFGYDEWFIDGVGILAKALINNGGKTFAHWPIEGYEFTESKALIPGKEDHFFGLAIDEDNQYEQTEDRCTQWVNILKKDLQSIVASLAAQV
ncbi:MAG: flavodoxin [Flavobacteriales bacterium]|nr:flavodoxin [Flavobacteriales bacterium]